MNEGFSLWLLRPLLVVNSPTLSHQAFLNIEQQVTLAQFHEKSGVSPVVVKGLPFPSGCF
jgi:hypothetical protein